MTVPAKCALWWQFDPLVLTVKDNGPGMSAEVAERMFEPQFTMRGGADLGLGLPIVKAIADRP